jgi:hypothetical protein
MWFCTTTKNDISVCEQYLNLNKKYFGDEGDRSPDLPHAKRTLYH